MLLLVERASAWFADHVIIANHLWHQKMVGRSVQKDKCSVIMNLPDDEIFSRFKGSFPEVKRDTFTILYPGTLVVHQGIETVLLALELVREKIPRIRFKMYGKGTDEDYFRDIVDRKGLSDIVSFCGLIPIDKIPEIMSEADIGIAPTLNDGFADEAFSTKILEFMRVGIPVIVSGTTVHRHYIPDTCVQFYPSGDSHELAESILRLYNDPQLRSRLLESSSEFIRSSTWKQGEEVYFRILEGLGRKVCADS
jgi:glycosyltransferase involved in cell wall biosynthesis